MESEEPKLLRFIGCGFTKIRHIGTLRMIFSLFQLQGGTEGRISLWRTDSLLFSKKAKSLFIIIQFTPIASQFSSTNTSYLSSPKRQRQCRFSVRRHLGLLSPPPTIFCICTLGSFPDKIDIFQTEGTGVKIAVTKDD